jgi:hypothetical protein
MMKFSCCRLLKDLQGECTKCTFDKHLCLLVNLIAVVPLMKRGKERNRLKVVKKALSLHLELQPVSKSRTPSEGGGGCGHKRTWAHCGKLIIYCSVDSANFSLCRNHSIAVY